MMFELFIAKKHIFEHKKQSIIGIVGIAIGIIVLTVSIGISNGLNKNMISSILSLSSHVIIKNNGNIKNYEKIEEKLKSIEGIKAVIPKVSTQGIVTYNGILGKYVTGMKIEGIDFTKSINPMELGDKIVQGTINSKNLKGVIVGEEFIRHIGGKIGDEISVISENNKELKLEIMATFQSGYLDYDMSMILLPLKTAQYITERNNTVSSIELILNDPYDAEKISNLIYEKLSLRSQTWGDINSNLLKALNLEKVVMIIAFSLIVLIAGFVVWVMLNTMVREKIKYIGIMRSMGISNKSITKIFLIQGMILGFLGIIIGTILSLILLWYIKTYSLPGISSIYYLSKIPVELSFEEILTIISFNSLLIILSSVFPAIKAGNLKIVEALKHD